MSNGPKKEETIFYDGTLFRIGDIVTVKTDYRREYTGRISGIDISNFRLDMSERYQWNWREFKYDEISWIKYAEEPSTSASTDGDGK